MPREKLIPQGHKSTGRRSDNPTAKLGENGLLSLNVATVKLLGEPDMVLVDCDLDTKTLWLQPTTPTDAGGWSLSGGGNTTYRVRLAAFSEKFNKAGMAGEYAVSREARTVKLQKSEARP